MFRAFATTLLLLFACGAAPAHEIVAGDLTIVHPFVKATAPGARAGAGYMKIRNDGDADDRLIAIESPEAPEVSLHQSIVSNGMASMPEMAQGLLVPAHGEAILGAAGSHAMFMGIAAPFELGQVIDATLVFEHAGRIPVTFEVEPIDADPMAVEHQH